ncbi:hypothetical protein DPMN_091993 [Dreissena polymorpha]|uniref:Uncharacterized protein n=1 Tax=Dreissena polymorpha TaxID=45954 RepID=A0A9D4L0H9_DREPO|nr:hypothetical protein DPMN_091993 [Dreissena polymorpha]
MLPLRDQYRDLPVTKPVSRHPIHYMTGDGKLQRARHGLGVGLGLGLSNYQLTPEISNGECARATSGQLNQVRNVERGERTSSDWSAHSGRKYRTGNAHEQREMSNVDSVGNIERGLRTSNEWSAQSGKKYRTRNAHEQREMSNVNSTNQQRAVQLNQVGNIERGLRASMTYRTGTAHEQREISNGDCARATNGRLNQQRKISNVDFAQQTRSRLKQPNTEVNRLVGNIERGLRTSHWKSAKSGCKYRTGIAHEQRVYVISNIDFARVGNIERVLRMSNEWSAQSGRKYRTGIADEQRVVGSIIAKYRTRTAHEQRKIYRTWAAHEQRGISNVGCARATSGMKYRTETAHEQRGISNVDCLNQEISNEECARTNRSRLNYEGNTGRGLRNSH